MSNKRSGIKLAKWQMYASAFLVVAMGVFFATFFYIRSAILTIRH